MSKLTNKDESKIDENNYLDLFLDKEDYNIEIMKVKEFFGIIDYSKISTTIPIRGLIHLRGKVIPVK